MCQNVVYILVGWLLGILTTLVERCLETKKDKEKKETEIISETLKYLFRIKQTYNNLITDKLEVERNRTESPDKSSELERQMYNRLDSEISKDFFPDLMFHSFQLKRVRDKSFWRDFEKLMNKYEELGNIIIGQADMHRVSQLNTQVMALMKNFVEKCTGKAQVYHPTGHRSVRLTTAVERGR